MCLQRQLCVLSGRPGCFGTCLNSCDTVTRPSVTTSVFFDRLTLLVVTILASAPFFAARYKADWKSETKMSGVVFVPECGPQVSRSSQLGCTRLSRRETSLCLVLECCVFFLKWSAVSSFWLAWEGPVELCSVWGRRDAAENQHPAKWLRKEGKKMQVFMLILAATLPNVLPESCRKNLNKAKL